MNNKQIKTALISVFHKDGLEELLQQLSANGVKFLSTGGTQAFIESLGYECQKVEDVTTYPSILGGRVKTLHPKIYADIIEKIDIGGISLIRAGAKNFNDVVIIPSKDQYAQLVDILKAQGAVTTLEQRRQFATAAFGVSSHYDTAIHAWFSTK